MIKRSLIKTGTTIEELPGLIDYAQYIGQAEELIIKPLEACYKSGRRVHSADKLSFARGYIAAKRAAQVIVSNNFED